MGKPLKRTNYCDLLAQGITQIGEDISAVERIFIKDIKREEIRFAWYKEDNEGKRRFIPRPLDLTEVELLELIKDGVNKEVFSKEFREELKKITKVGIADVTHTLTDDTYYVSPIVSIHSPKYISHSIGETIKLLANDNWSFSGKVGKWDYSLVDMWSREDELIAIWEE
ncbi:hypothetical protein [Bacillus sp. MRMR6]|uniref:hypothetical protein n=1 Tax=Bacillus sp. MRMR6 TaxID=1928617 RepID=UPI000952A0BE|nr:hypothetical protein [Bacillus sp. MRMR6]OLS38599.1 hypothetical protein BTR25_14375 [Bacillus sp. MRMR6]